MTRIIEDIATTTKIPPELRRSLPREVALTGAGGTLLALAAVLLAAGLVGGAWLYTMAAADAARAELRRREGIATTAEIIHIRRTRGEKPRAILDYRFRVAAREYSGRGSMRARDARGLEVGASVAVSYLRSAPQENWLAGHPPGGVPLALPPLLAAGLIAAAALIGWSLRRQLAFLRESRPAVARVVAWTRKVQGRSAQRSSQRLQVEFEDLSGARHTSHYDVLRDPPPVGSTVVIVYDRENPRRIAAYPMTMVRVVTP